MFARHDGRCRGHESDIGKPSLKRCFVIPPSLDVTFKVKRFYDLLTIDRGILADVNVRQIGHFRGNVEENRSPLMNCGGKKNE
jgi:hypothetical protein